MPKCDLLRNDKTHRTIENIVELFYPFSGSAMHIPSIQTVTEFENEKLSRGISKPTQRGLFSPIFGTCVQQY